MLSNTSMTSRFLHLQILDSIQRQGGHTLFGYLLSFAILYHLD